MVEKNQNIQSDYDNSDDRKMLSGILVFKRDKHCVQEKSRIQIDKKIKLGLEKIEYLFRSI